MNPPLSALSWILGLADYVYYFLRPRIRKKRKFFHNGYGDAAMLRRLRGHVAGAFLLVMRSLAHTAVMPMWHPQRFATESSYTDHVFASHFMRFAIRICPLFWPRMLP